MKDLKKIWFILIGIAILVLLGYINLPQQIAENSDHVAELVESELQLPEIDAQQPKQNIHNTATNEQSKLTDNGLQSELTKDQPAKKRYEDDWCDWATELSEEDLLFAQSELIEWNKTIGHVPTNQPQHELASYVAAYEDLPLEKLESLALEGDKWAMVAYAQIIRVDDEQKPKYQNRIAKRLMVQGESYYAVSHLVRKALSAARIDFVKEGEETAINRLADALAYMYWGLEHYNHGGVRGFLIYTEGEPFGKELPLDVALAKAEKKAQYKLSVLINRTKKKRAEAGIDFPEPPRVMEVVFSHLVAFWHSTGDKAQLDLLRSLDIPTNKRIAVTSCVEKYLEAAAKRKS